MSATQSHNYDAFMERYEVFHENFLRYCRMKSFALISTEDLMQEAILSTLNALERVKDYDLLLPYMIQVVNNIVNNHSRRKKFSASWDDDLLQSIEAKVEDPEVALDIQYLYQCIDQLPEKEKTALTLFEISGFSIQEISLIQESTLGATKTRISRARTKLKKIVRSEKPSFSLKNQLVVLTSLFI